MSGVKTRLLLLAFCLCARVVLGGESVAAVVKRSLGFDLSSVSFGASASTNSGYRAADPPVLKPPFVTNAVWMTSAASKRYSRDFPNRAVRYGFREGRLVVIQISVTLWSVTAPTTPETGDRRPELAQIRNELLESSSPGKFGFEDASYRVHYAAMCGERDEHPVRIDVQITPMETAKAP